MKIHPPHQQQNNNHTCTLHTPRTPRTHTDTMHKPSRAHTHLLLLLCFFPYSLWRHSVISCFSLQFLRQRHSIMSYSNRSNRVFPTFWHWLPPVRHCCCVAVLRCSPWLSKRFAPFFHLSQFKSCVHNAHAPHRKHHYNVALLHSHLISFALRLFNGGEKKKWTKIV